jgi:hypothetical protein
MKRLIIAASLVIVILSCQKETTKARTFSSGQITDTTYVKVTEMHNYNVPEQGVRMMYWADTNAVKELILMINSNDGHGWTQKQGDLTYQRFLIGGYYFKYFFHLVLKDNSTFDTQIKEYHR